MACTVRPLDLARGIPYSPLWCFGLVLVEDGAYLWGG